MEQSVIVLKAKTDKASLKTFAYQVAQITTQATKSNIQIVDLDCFYKLDNGDFLREKEMS